MPNNNKSLAAISNSQMKIQTKARCPVFFFIYVYFLLILFNLYGKKINAGWPFNQVILGMRRSLRICQSRYLRTGAGAGAGTSKKYPWYITIKKFFGWKFSI